MNVTVGTVLFVTFQFAQASCYVFPAWRDRSWSDHCAVKNYTPRIKGRFDGTASISAVSRWKRPQLAKNRSRRPIFPIICLFPRGVFHPLDLMPIHDRATQKRQQEAIQKKHQKETHHPQLTKAPGRGITPEGSGQGRAASGGANAALTAPFRCDTQ